MSKRKNKNKKPNFAVKDYVKAVRKADRETQLETQPGWQRTTNIHRSKKTYNRRNNNKNYLQEE